MIQFQVDFDLITFDVCLTARYGKLDFREDESAAVAAEWDDIWVLSVRQFTSLLSFMKHISAAPIQFIHIHTDWYIQRYMNTWINYTKIIHATPALTHTNRNVIGLVVLAKRLSVSDGI